ncbi:uncharacterized protein TRAVEDRAFT_73305 [Trametes versicolor FP-101664 SS1]|uniref:uncharacterized protein n=1 Tax=Trametes versicolor (strain FP-101664) TaxID=717944 RepID=UPI00046247A8|nr:uncharacterized protein TRAVEDRAFT_73305 [Trametes versicolor FP-101664 SS1]EIW57041.1 hypothetical protein TRAVEDRAFT_73305 [Trametes versicolor FP-101664 SS1]
MDHVISVSSRESTPAQGRPSHTAHGSSARSRAKRALPTGDVIELTDSDSEDLPANISHLFQPQNKRPRPKGKGKAQLSVAGPSRKRDEAPAAAVRVPREPSPAAQLPLFLPDLDAPEELAPALEHATVFDLGPAPPPAPIAPEPQVPVPPAIPHENLLQDAQAPFDAYVAQIMEIIPDVLPAHVYSLVEQHYPNYLDKVVEPVLHNLFENPDYPKADAKGKGKRKRDEEEEQAGRAVKPKIDYGTKERKWEGGIYYHALAMDQLISDFPDIPTAHIRETFQQHNVLYAPTFFALREHRTRKPLPYKAISRPRPKGKGKAIQQHDADFERELQWVQEKLEEEDAQKARELAEEARLQAEGGIECGCCFCEYPFDKMIQCPEAHLFCMSCMGTYAETKLGEHDARIVCMDQSGCKLPFPESELRRFLSPKLLELYERVKQRKEIEAAGLENLEECPFCDYKVVIENEQERLFRCENEACGAVTCRQCKKPDHLPKSCQEVSDDKKLDVRHAIEEAMTAALMRNCPKCQKAFVKELGCNKMTCPNCGSQSCYVCRQLIVGYEHFGNPPPYTGKVDPKKCPLWDASVEGRHSDEVTAAAKAVIDEYKRTHPELDEKDLAVDLPPPPPAAGPSHPGVRAHAHLHRPIPAFGFDLGAVGVGRLEFGAHGHAHGNMVALAEFVQAHPAPPQAAHARNARRAAERERRVDLVRMWQRQAQQAREELDVAQREAAHVLRRAAAHPPVQNVHVHIHHNQAPAPAPGPARAPAPVLPQQVFFPPAHFPAPPAAPVPAPPRGAPYVQVPGPARAPAPAARAPVAQRRSRRVQGRRAHLD